MTEPADAVTLAATPRTRALGGPVGLAVGLALAHGTVDAYVAFLHPLLPRIMDRLGLSITLAATLVVTLSVASSVLQPALGYLADRFGRRPYVVAGPLLAGVFLSLIGAAPGLGILILFLVLGGLGSAAFHPPGAALAARAAHGGRSGMRLSVFSFGGAAGYAAGPLIAVVVVGAVGLGGMWVAMVPGVLLALAIGILLPGDAARAAARPPPHPLLLLRALAGPLGLVFGISAAGAFVQRTFLTLEPIIAARAGAAEATGALMLSLYLAGQAAGTLASGVLTDRIDRRRILVGATVAGVPLHVLAVVAAPGSALGMGTAVAAGFLNMALLPPVVVMAQEMVPEGAAAGSGIVMGLAWATGSVAVVGAGALADRIGPVAAAAWMMPALLVGTLLALHPALRAYSRARPERAGGG